MVMANGAHRGHPIEGWLDTVWQDVTYCLRTFRHSPSFTLAAVAALALGIGTNTAIFSVNQVLLKPLPFPHPDRLLMFMNTSPQGSGPAVSPGLQGSPQFAQDEIAVRNRGRPPHGLV